MPSTSNGRKPKQLLQPKEPTRNWLELPSDLMVNILLRISVNDILENAQKVCTTWRKICKDPDLWRVICIDNVSDPIRWTVCLCKQMCKSAVDKSQGRLIDLSITTLCDYDLLHYIAERSSQLRHLKIIRCYDALDGSMGDVFKNLSLLEEFGCFRTRVSSEDIEAAGRYCPLLRTLKLNKKAFCSLDGDDDDKESQDEIALAIGKNLGKLTHLELIGNSMTNVGLEAILDGCCHLESLDLRCCPRVDLHGDLGKRCSEQIKFLKLPDASFEGCEDVYKMLDVFYDYHDEYHAYF